MSDQRIRISVFGSNPREDMTTLSREFAQAARRLGAAIVESGATLVVCSEKPSTADYHAVQGAISVADRGGSNVSIEVHCYQPHPTNRRVPYQDLRDGAGNYNFNLGWRFYERTAGSTPQDVHRGQIASSQGVVLLGGNSHAELAFADAREQGVPILAVGGYGGAGLRAS